MKPNVLKYLLISTCHMTAKDDKRLRKNKVNVVSDPYEYGYRVFVPIDDPQEAYNRMKEAKLSKSFIKVLKWARQEKMDWVQFDCDGPIYPRFKKHSW